MHDCDKFVPLCRGGLLFGGLAGVFYGVQLLSSIARARRDYQDTMAAGLATGVVFGAACALTFSEGNLSCSTLQELRIGKVLSSAGSDGTGIAGSPWP